MASLRLTEAADPTWTPASARVLLTASATAVRVCSSWRSVAMRSWLTRGGWPVAAAKLAYCERTTTALREQEPMVTDASLDEDVTEIEYSLGHYYRDAPPAAGPVAGAVVGDRSTPAPDGNGARRSGVAPRGGG